MKKMTNEDMKKDDPKNPDVNRHDVDRDEDDPKDLREANENIRKAQGEDGGPRPMIDRHR